MELHLDPLPKKHWKIEWTSEMIKILMEKFSTSYNKELAQELGVSWRSVVRKARELNIIKESEFLEKRRKEISEMAIKAHPPQPTKGQKGWSVPNSEHTQFQKGNIPPTKTNPSLIIEIQNKRKASFKRDRIRIKAGLEPYTNLYKRVYSKIMN